MAATFDDFQSSTATHRVVSSFSSFLFSIRGILGRTILIIASAGLPLLPPRSLPTDSQNLVSRVPLDGDVGDNINFVGPVARRVCLGRKRSGRWKLQEHRGMELRGPFQLKCLPWKLTHFAAEDTFAQPGSLASPCLPQFVRWNCTSCSFLVLTHRQSHSRISIPTCKVGGMTLVVTQSSVPTSKSNPPPAHMSRPATANGVGVFLLTVVLLDLGTYA